MTPPDGAGEPERPGPGHVQPTSGAVLVFWGLTGLVGGWLLRPVGDRLFGTPPLVSWLQVSALAFAAVALGVIVWSTYRTFRVERIWIEPERKVNRLLLAKACAVVAVLLVGGYSGYAISWIGLGTELANQRMVRSGAAAVCSIAVLCGSLALERLCRVKTDGDEH